MTRRTEQLLKRERRKMGLILGVSVVLAAILGGLVISVSAQRHQVRARCTAAEDALASYGPAARAMPLPVQLLDSRYSQQVLSAEWERYSRLLDGSVASTQVSTNVGDAALIDFKVALFEARRRIAARAAESGAKLPADLGMSEAIGADENTGDRLLQLAAIERLVGVALNVGISVIREIRPLECDVIPADAEIQMTIGRYPVLFSFQCSRTQLEQLYAEVADAPCFFALNRLKIEWSSVDHPDRFDVMVVFSVLAKRNGVAPTGGR